MPLGPEDIARERIDRMLVAGWAVQDAKAVNFFHKPETFADWLTNNSLSRHSRPDRESRDSSGNSLDPRVREDDELKMAAEGQGLFGKQPTLNSRIRQMPPLIGQANGAGAAAC